MRIEKCLAGGRSQCLVAVGERVPVGISELEVLFSYLIRELQEIRQTPGKTRYKISMVRSLFEDVQARCREQQPGTRLGCFARPAFIG